MNLEMMWHVRGYKIKIILNLMHKMDELDHWFHGAKEVLALVKSPKNNYYNCTTFQFTLNFMKKDNKMFYHIKR